MSILDLQTLPLSEDRAGTFHMLGASNLSILLCIEPESSILPETGREASAPRLHELATTAVAA